MNALREFEKRGGLIGAGDDADGIPYNGLKLLAEVREMVRQARLARGK